jgi:hypothetical protein
VTGVLLLAALVAVVVAAFRFGWVSWALTGQRYTDEQRHMRATRAQRRAEERHRRDMAQLPALLEAQAQAYRRARQQEQWQREEAERNFVSYWADGGPDRDRDQSWVALTVKHGVRCRAGAGGARPSGGEALAALAGTCAAAIGELAELRGLEVGKVLDGLLDDCPTGSVVDWANEQGAVARILELRAEW